MLASQRCPLCTLELPCRHFESQEQLYTQRGKLFKKAEWSLLTQENRNVIIRLKLELQRKMREERLDMNAAMLKDNSRSFHCIDTAHTSQIEKSQPVQQQLS